MESEHSANRDTNQSDDELRQSERRISLAGFWFIVLVAIAGLRWIPATESSPQAALPAALLAQVAASSGKFGPLSSDLHHPVKSVQF